MLRLSRSTEVITLPRSPSARPRLRRSAQLQACALTAPTRRPPQLRHVVFDTGPICEARDCASGTIAEARVRAQQDLQFLRAPGETRELVPCLANVCPCLSLGRAIDGPQVNPGHQRAPTRAQAHQHSNQSALGENGKGVQANVRLMQSTRVSHLPLASCSAPPCFASTSRPLT